MEILIFTMNAIVIYLLSDWIVRRIEQNRGKTLEHRQLIFFAIFLLLALISFRILQDLLGRGL